MKNKIIKSTFAVALTSLLAYQVVNPDSFSNNVEIEQTKNSTKKVNHKEIRGTRGTKALVRYTIDGDGKFFFSFDADCEYQYDARKIESSIYIIEENNNRTDIPEEEIRISTFTRNLMIDVNNFDLANWITDFTKSLKIFFRFEVPDTRDEIEIFEGSWTWSENIIPEILSVDYESGVNQISGSVDADSNGYELIGGEVIATPRDFGNEVYGTFNAHDGLFLITDLSEAMTYKIAITLTYVKPDGTIATSNTFRFITKTQERDDSIHDWWFVAKDENSATIAFTSKAELTSNDIKIENRSGDLFTFNLISEEISPTEPETEWRNIVTITNLNSSTEYEVKITDTTTRSSTSFMRFETDDPDFYSKPGEISELILFPEQKDLRIVFDYNMPYTYKYLDDNQVEQGDTLNESKFKITFNELDTGNSSEFFYDTGDSQNPGPIIHEGINSIMYHDIQTLVPTLPALNEGMDYSFTIEYSWDVTKENSTDHLAQQFTRTRYFSTKPGKNYLDWYAIEVTEEQAFITFDYQLYNAQSHPSTYTMQLYKVEEFGSDELVWELDTSRDIKQPYNTVTIPNLEPNTEYRITLEVEDDLGNIDKSTNVFTTKSIERDSLSTGEVAMISIGSLLGVEALTALGYMLYKKYNAGTDMPKDGEKKYKKSKLQSKSKFDIEQLIEGEGLNPMKYKTKANMIEALLKINKI